MNSDDLKRIVKGKYGVISRESGSLNLASCFCQSPDCCLEPERLESTASRCQVINIKPS